MGQNLQKEFVTSWVMASRTNTNFFDFNKVETNFSKVWVTQVNLKIMCLPYISRFLTFYNNYFMVKSNYILENFIKRNITAI